MASPDARRFVSDADAPDPNRWRALSVTLVAGFMSLLDVSIVSVALPSLQQSLGADPAAVQWVVSGYALTFGLALVPAGRLGDALGRRRVFLASTLLARGCGQGSDVEAPPRPPRVASGTSPRWAGQGGAMPPRSAACGPPLP